MPLQTLSDMSQLQVLQGALEALLRQVLLVPALTFGLLALTCLLDTIIRRVRALRAVAPRRAASGAVVRPAASPQ